MAPQQKGKQGTKGAKQIVEENAVTLSFYRNMIMGSAFIYFVLMWIHSDGFGTFEIGFFLFAAAILSGSLQFMKFMSKASYSQDGKQLLDSGVDLNMEAGVAEHIKDIIILTCTTLVLSYFSRYFWFLWLLVPLKGGWVAWSKLISPWIFAPGPPENTAQDEKKARKMERRLRHQ